MRSGLAGRLRLLQIVDAIDVGGAGKVALQGIRALVASGVRVDSANFEYPGRPSRFTTAAHSAGANTLTLRQTGRLDYSFIDELAEQASKLGVTLVESHSLKSNVVAWMASRRLGVPWIAFAHGWTSETLRVRAYNVIEQRALLRWPDHVVAVADTIERRLREGGRTGPVTVLPNGIEASATPVQPAERHAARMALGYSDDDFIGAVVGRLSHEKAVDLLLQAVARIATQIPRLKVAVVGEGRERPTLEAARAALGLENVVRFFGQLADVRPVMAAADVLLLPSRTEGLPNVALEALDAGLPILSTRVGAMPELIADGVTGWLVPVGDPSAFGSRLAELALRRDLRSVGLAGREQVLPRYTADARVAKLFALYSQLLPARAAA